MTDHELTVLLILSGLALAAAMIALAGWPSFLNWRKRRRFGRAYHDLAATALSKFDDGTDADRRRRLEEGWPS